MTAYLRWPKAGEFPGFRPRSGVGGVQVIRSGDMEQSAQDEREFLQRGDDDLRSVHQRIGELFRIGVDGLDHALGVFDLIDGVLKLAVEDLAVGDDDHVIKDFPVVGVWSDASRYESYEMPLVLPDPAEC